MHPQIEEKLTAIIDDYFNHPSPVKRYETERMFQAFKARIMLETRLDGSSHGGVVRGCLVDERK